MVKIIDVAKMAGVSKSTVSRVLNGEASVKESTRVAVQEAIEKLDYSPSYFAQGIRTRKTHTIAMLVPEYSNFFYSEMFQGAEDVALMNGYMVLVCSTLRRADSELAYIRELLRRNVDGIIFNTYAVNDETMEFLKRISDDLPIVLMNRLLSDDDRFSYVYTDGFAATRSAVSYLAERGHRSIGYIRNVRNISITEDRFEGYLAGMKDCGLPVDPAFLYQMEEPVDPNPDYIDLGRRIGARIAASSKRPDALLSVIDMLAIGCIKECRRQGMRIPEDMSVVGFDNVSLSQLVEPELTTIAQPTRKLGQKAAQIIIDRINGKTTEANVAFAGELIVRESTR